MVTGSPGSPARPPRQWRRRLRQLRPLLLSAVVVAGLGVIGYAVFFSTWLAADRVEVKGGSSVSDQAVVRAAAIEPQTPLARVDLDAVDDRVSQLAAVANADVHRAWPHTISITVEERQPVATIHRDGSWQVLDKEGVLYLKTTRRNPQLAVLQFQGEATRVALREVGRVVVALPTSLRSQLKHLEASSMDSIHLRLRGGREVVWGSAAESDRKVKVLLLLMQRPASVYDVSVPEQPTTSPR